MSEKIVGVFVLVLLLVFLFLPFSANSASCHETTSNPEQCYLCCIGTATAKLRRLDLEKKKFDSGEFCNRREQLVLMGRAEDFGYDRKRAMMSEAAAEKYCDNLQKVNDGPPSNEDPCIKNCRKHFGVK